jgi:hypothetical protein
MSKSSINKTFSGLLMQYDSFPYFMRHSFRVTGDDGKLKPDWVEHRLRENEYRLRDLERFNHWNFDPTFGYIDKWHREAGPNWWYPANRPEKKANHAAYAVGGLAAYAVLTKKARKNVKFERSDFFEWKWSSPTWKVNPLETAGAVAGLVVGVMNATRLSPALGLGAILGAIAYESHLDRESYAAISAHGL